MRQSKKQGWVPDKYKRKVVVDYMVKQSLAVWGDSSSESDESKNPEEAFMLDVEDGKIGYNSLFALMAKSNYKEEEEVTLFNISQNLSNYTSKKLKKLVSVPIDSFCDLTAEKYLDKVENP